MLAEFAQSRSEDAFSTLVERHLPMVYGVASRITDCPSLAEEVAQSTFAKLAHQAKRIDKNVVIGGWLYNAARNAALTSARSERRRRQRETLNTEMNSSESDQPLVAEHLEEAMSQLKEGDRSALVLRYFEDRNLREVGCELGISEDAARMRVNRALEKLKSSFGKLGVTGTTAWFATAIPSSASATVPVGLSTSITSSVIAGGITVGSVAAIATETAINNTMSTLMNLKTSTAILAAATITGTATYVTQKGQIDVLQTSLDSLSESHSQFEKKHSDAAAAINLRDRQIVQLEEDYAELHRLRGDLAAMNTVLAENDRLNVELLSNWVAEQQLSAEELAARELNETPTVQFGSFIDAAGNISHERSHQSTFALENPGASLVVCAFHQPGGPLDMVTGAPRDALITIQPNSTNYVTLPVSQTEATALNVKLMKVTSSREMTVSVP
ncbi:sigma-70 family RNA polymerase sigma factor [Verrucomicrobia bacterium]|nr:sigma-70 family RNA polymerase sigma factor [Verrucomicrobiota bacterium]